MWSFKAQREIQVLQVRDLPVTGASTAHFGRMLDTDLAGLAELGLEPVRFFCGPRPCLLGKGALTPPHLSPIYVYEPFALKQSGAVCLSQELWSLWFPSIRLQLSCTSTVGLLPALQNKA